MADPVPGSVAAVAVDMDITGNGLALGGPVDTDIGGIPVNATHDIDIVVDEIDIADGLSGLSLNLRYSPSVLI